MWEFKASLIEILETIISFQRVTTMEEEHARNVVRHCDRLFDETQEMEMQVVETIEKWRYDWEKAYDKD